MSAILPREKSANPAHAGSGVRHTSASNQRGAQPGFGFADVQNRLIPGHSEMSRNFRLTAADARPSCDFAGSGRLRKSWSVPSAPLGVARKERGWAPSAFCRVWEQMRNLRASCDTPREKNAPSRKAEIRAAVGWRTPVLGEFVPDVLWVEISDNFRAAELHPWVFTYSQSSEQPDLPSVFGMKPKGC